MQRSRKTGPISDRRKPIFGEGVVVTIQLPSSRGVDFFYWNNP